MSESATSIRQLVNLERKQKRRQLLGQPGLLAVSTVLVIILLLFTIYPLAIVFLRTIWDGGLDISLLKRTLGNRAFATAFGNSVLLGVVVALLASVIGFVFAFSVSRTSMKGKRFFNLVAMLPIVSPPFVIALAMILLFGRSGMITKGLLGIRTANVYGMHSLIIVQTLALFPLAYLNIKGVLESINTAVEDAAQSLGASRGQIFRTVTLPLCAPAILSSFLIVFIKSISDFGNPQILGGDYDTLSSQAYLQINGMNNTRAGSLIAISILLPAMIAFIIQKYWVSRKSFVSVTGKPTRGSAPISEKYIVYPLTVLCGLFTAAVLLFYGTVVWISFVRLWGVDMSLTFANYREVINRGGEYIIGSLQLSLIATPIASVLGMLIAYMIVRKDFIGKKAIEFGSMLVFAVPGIVLGIAYILAFNRRPILLTGTATIIIAAMVFRHLSVGVEAGTNCLRQVDASIEEASVNLGANSAVTFWKISFPLMRSAFFTSLVNTFVRSMTSISAVIFLISVNYNLLTVLIMSEVEGGRYGTASAYCVMLMMIVFVAFGIMGLMIRLINHAGARRNANG